jgi:hypothetical protein
MIGRREKMILHSEGVFVWIEDLSGMLGMTFTILNDIWNCNEHVGPNIA